MDIVERLRNGESGRNEAADEIERLRDQVKAQANFAEYQSNVIEHFRYELTQRQAGFENGIKALEDNCILRTELNSLNLEAQSLRGRLDSQRMQTEQAQVELAAAQAKIKSYEEQ